MYGSCDQFQEYIAQVTKDTLVLLEMTAMCVRLDVETVFNAWNYYVYAVRHVIERRVPLFDWQDFLDDAMDWSGCLSEEAAIVMCPCL